MVSEETVCEVDKLWLDGGEYDEKIIRSSAEESSFKGRRLFDLFEGEKLGLIKDPLLGSLLLLGLLVTAVGTDVGTLVSTVVGGTTGVDVGTFVGAFVGTDVGTDVGKFVG